MPAPGLIAAALAGVAAFASPCMWPVYPVWLAYVAGDVRTPATGAAGPRLQRVPPPALLRTALFLCGFALVFVALGATASALGRALGAQDITLERVSGLAMLAFGLALAGVLPARLLGTARQLPLPRGRRGHVHAAVAGAVFAFAWSPCFTGPVLASILLLAGLRASLWSGTALLAAFTAGFAVPFLLLSLWLERAQGLLRRLAPAMPWVTRGSGLLLALLGLLVVVGTVPALAGAGTGAAL